MQVELDGDGDFGFDGFAVELRGAEGPIGDRCQRCRRQSRIAGDHFEAVSFAIFADKRIHSHRAGHLQALGFSRIGWIVLANRRGDMEIGVVANRRQEQRRRKNRI